MTSLRRLAPHTRNVGIAGILCLSSLLALTRALHAQPSPSAPGSAGAPAAAFPPTTGAPPLAPPAQAVPSPPPTPGSAEPGAPLPPASPPAAGGAPPPVGPPPAPLGPPPALSAPPAAATAAPARAAAPASEPPEPPEPRAERRLYLLGAALGAFHAHGSQYELTFGERGELASGGLGYELLLMVGSRKRDFAFGGAVSFIHVPSGVAAWNEEEIQGYDLSALATTVGPAVDYRPARAFHIGGLMGLAIERAPEFDPTPRELDTLVGFGAGLWLGFDWEVSPEYRVGALLTAHLKQELHRDVAVIEEDDQNAEVSVSLGLGVSLARF